MSDVSHVHVIAITNNVEAAFTHKWYYWAVQAYKSHIDLIPVNEKK